MALNAGQIIHGRYRIARLLGQGGMGAVYRAWDLSLNLPVALKEMLPDPTMDSMRLHELREQFRREAQVLATLSHPNLPRVTDFFEWNANVYLIMDFIEGDSLAAIIEHQGPLPEHQVLLWAAQLLDALQACHERNIIHRDIKPQNIIICKDGRAVLVDFGLVKLWDPKQPQTQRIIQGMGTREYASPEQYGIGGGHTEPQSDIYSLGATLYHALTGQEPASAMERLSQPDILRSFQETGVMVRPQVESAIFQSMALRPDQRFVTTFMMKTALTAPVSAPTYPSFAPYKHTAVMPQQPWAQAENGQVPTPTRVSTRTQLNPPLNPPWQLELGAAILMAVVGTIVTQLILWGLSAWDALVGMSIGAVFAGTLGWIIGDTIFQALTQPGSGTALPAAVNRPTQRLVASTRMLMEKLSTSQQIVLIAVLMLIVVLAAWLLGPLILSIPFLWNNFPSYAIAGVLVYTAVGRKTGFTVLTQVLVILIGGLVLKVRIGFGVSVSKYFICGVLGGILMEAVAFITDRLLIKPKTRDVV